MHDDDCNFTADNFNSGELARFAECGTPDLYDRQNGDGSPGAQFLRRVAADAAELASELSEGEHVAGGGSFTERADYDDALHERADGAIPVYTHERWMVFVDLQAYDEDASDLGATADDLTQAAGAALYMIAERLIRALLDVFEFQADDETEEDDDDDE